MTEFTDNDESYTYDNVGNMLTKSINDITTTYRYNVGNQLVEEVSNGQTIGYTYNANGDLTEKSTGEQYSYDIQGNLASIVGNNINKQYTYNGSGNRLSETTNGETTYFVNDLNQSYEQVLQTYDSDGNVINTYTYGVQRINSVGEINETYLYDGRGSVVGTVDSNNDFVSYSYTAYGELMPNSSEPKVFGYNGEAIDFETRLQYLRARYYDTTVGRFLQEDDFRGSYTNPISMNRYAYVYNNPVMGRDPSGYNTLEDYAYQQSMKSKTTTTKSSNFYIDYYTSKAKATEPEVKKIHNTAEYYQYMYGKDTPKVQYNDNGEVLVKNPFGKGPTYVTIEEYNCLRDGNDINGTEEQDEQESLKYYPSYNKELLYSDFWENDSYFSGDWFLDPEKLEEATNKLAAEMNGEALWELDNSYKMEVIQAIVRVKDTNVTGWFDEKTLTAVEDRLTAIGSENRDAQYLTGEEIIAIYESTDQNRNELEKWYLSGGNLIVQGMFTFAYGSLLYYGSTTNLNSNTTSENPSNKENYNPINEGPLSKEVTDTFRSSTYNETTLTQDTTFYRVYGGNAGKVGSYMSRTLQNGGIQSQMDLALNPSWGNTAQYVTEVTVPQGTVIYEGAAASQTINGGAGQLLGGGNQVYIPEVNSGWFN